MKFSNADVSFSEGTLMWKSYTTSKVLPTIKQVQIVNPKEFVIAALNMDSKTFVVHIVIREKKEMVINFGRKIQIKVQSGAQIGALLFDKALTEVPAKYSD